MTYFTNGSRMVFRVVSAHEHGNTGIKVVYGISLDGRFETVARRVDVVFIYTPVANGSHWAKVRTAT